MARLTLSGTNHLERVYVTDHWGGGKAGWITSNGAPQQPRLAGGASQCYCEKPDRDCGNL